MLTALFTSFFVVVPVILFFLLISAVFTVEQQTVAIIERFGKFVRMAKPGLNFRIPFIDRIAGRVTLRIQQLDVKAETKTKDNVFVTVIVSVQYFILPEKVYEAFYKLNNPGQQINSYVFDTIRARVPKITLDELFEKKEEIAMAVKEELNETMIDFGFEILNSLVTDIEPDQKVKDAMNEINAAQRLRVAASEKGEAEKIIKVKAAEADAESKALQGKGIADQRKAIIEGLTDSVDGFQKSIPGSSPQDVMNLVLMTQYFDTLKEIGADSKTNTLLIPHGPGGMHDLAGQLREAMITSNVVNNNTK
ncbi:SPFH domain-containing protein [Candidatus Dojkabacteria bacterium]|jgi:regulator of protease activity HflC (stomatin/prohibitin superfamily)|uniref:SPFH domain-containing protein n=1 Tax=Candidatus Dojkabacteria bacterium TaxID=2099670 RepID=A0A955L0D6_9BACT|nr:SPFH domain-containing protein [Candidatus Dojkabacteria bacterium]